MMLGKRPRHPLKRTTSITEFNLDLSLEENLPQQPSNPSKNGGGGGGATVSPRNHRRNLADYVETAPFLRACSLCNRRLVPSLDIYMYRGEIAFCSLECRQQQMKGDERKEKCSLASKKEAAPVPAPATAGGSDVAVSTKGETVAAL